MNWEECPLRDNGSEAYESVKRQGHAPWSIFIRFQSSVNPNQEVICSGKIEKTFYRILFKIEIYSDAH